MTNETDPSIDSDRRISEVIAEIMKLSDDERLKVFKSFCLSCGADDPMCQCWNDE